MGFLSRIFRRSKPAPSLPPINEDWKAGDWAQAIRGFFKLPGYPRDGHTYLVTSVHPGHTDDGTPGWGLIVAGCPAGMGISWNALGFRKITPDAFEEPRRTSVKIGEDA